LVSGGGGFGRNFGEIDIAALDCEEEELHQADAIEGDDGEDGDETTARQVVEDGLADRPEGAAEILEQGERDALGCGEEAEREADQKGELEEEEDAGGDLDQQEDEEEETFPKQEVETADLLPFGQFAEAVFDPGGDPVEAAFDEPEDAGEDGPGEQGFEDGEEEGDPGELFGAGLEGSFDRCGPFRGDLGAATAQGFGVGVGDGKQEDLADEQGAEVGAEVANLDRLEVAAFGEHFEPAGNLAGAGFGGDRPGGALDQE
jgi:hypothetical protein